MKPVLFFIMLAFGMLQNVCGQSFELSGVVRDGNNEGVPFASVFLLDIEDSTLVKGTSADEKGLFLIKDIAPDLYFLRASYVGRSSKVLALDISGDIKIGAVIISQGPQQLNEVTVVANKPQVERKVDRLVFNVERTVLSQGSSWDILKQTPGVIAMQDELQIRNRAATVYINDRKVQLSNEEIRSLLENYQGANIKSVEVINNPPAKYDAEGGAVLNIITSRNISLGYKGNINANITQGIFPKFNFGTSHFYKTKKLNINASYAFAPKKEFKDLRSTINFIDDTGVFSRWNTNYDQTGRSRNHSGNVVLDYEFDDRNELNLTSNIQFSPYRRESNFQDTEILGRTGVRDSTFTTASFFDQTKNNISGDLTFKHHFKESGKLSLNGHYTYFDLTRAQNAQSDYFRPDGAFIRDFSFFTDATQDIEIITTQLDYTDLLGTVGLETGVKGSFINAVSRLDYFTLNDNIQTLVPQLSDNYIYDENVYAGYFSLNGDWEKWSIKAGLRGEYTQSSGTSINLATINDLEYFELFPTFYLLHTVNEGHSFAFDYSRKLKRPRYEDLNPFRTFINENNFVEGNPNLLPAFSNNFNLNYTLKQEFFFDLYYRDNGNYISTLSFQDNENRILRDITQNVLESTSYGLDFNYGKSISNNWYLYSYISIFHEDETFLALESNNVQVTNNVDGVYLDLTNYLTLSKDGSFKGELGFTYLSGFLQGSYKQAETTNLTIGFRKSFWDRRALFSISANDILGKANGRVTSRYLNQDNSYLIVPETQYVRFGFTYNFGNFRLADNKREIDKTERNRLNPE
ncbi:outer membrane beta-barrel family protein [Maribacter sp. 2304DJ31-5]|uniref:outer membrane beta-barrel family protein n=1 Tax=Maribacter sp. 2304DJ31-5 TaxID=3386273 RepID=UPI0039BD2DE7